MSDTGGSPILRNHTTEDRTMRSASSYGTDGNLYALDQYLHAIDRSETAREAAEREIYKRIEPIIKDLANAIEHHARYNEASMDRGEIRDYILETLGELL